MTPGAERLLVLSLRLLKTAANPKFDNERKGVMLQNLTTARDKTLREFSLDGLSPTDTARLELAKYFGIIAIRKVQSEI